MMTRTNSDEKGVTLIELLVVMAMAVILTVSIGAAWNRQGSSSSSATWTQQILVMMRQARTRAQESGGYTQVVINGGGTTVQLRQAATLGSALPASWLLMGQEEATQGAAVIATANATSGTFTGGLPATITFRADGSATNDAVNLNGRPQTTGIFIRDGGSRYPSRVAVYGLTGYSRSMPGWQ